MIPPDVWIKIKDVLNQAGATAVGLVAANEVDDENISRFKDWLQQGYNARMHYIANWSELRFDPRNLLENAKSVITLAFSYSANRGRNLDLPTIASYAWGEDYHDVIRRRLKEAVEKISSLTATDTDKDFRICIDSAPVMERYWALKSGIGVRGNNGLVIIPEIGSKVFLAEIMTTLQFSDSSLTEVDKEGRCHGCGHCQIACPAGALQKDGRVDARKCLSYLTIEHRGHWDAEGCAAMATEAGGHTLYGCDICQDVCPYNNEYSDISTSLAEFASKKDELNHIDSEKAKSINQEDFSRLFKGSAIKRSKYAGWQRNADNLT